MTLQEFLAALTNDKMLVTVQDHKGVEKVKLYAQGYEQLVAELLASEVDYVTIVNPNNCTIQLAEVITA